MSFLFSSPSLPRLLGAMVPTGLAYIMLWFVPPSFTDTASYLKFIYYIIFYFAFQLLLTVRCRTAESFMNVTTSKNPSLFPICVFHQSIYSPLEIQYFYLLDQKASPRHSLPPHTVVGYYGKATQYFDAQIYKNFILLSVYQIQMFVTMPNFSG